MTSVSVVLGDFRELMKGLADSSIDAIIADPPYGTHVERDGYRRREHFGLKDRIVGDADMSALEGLLSDSRRVMKPDGWLAVFCSPKRRSEVEVIFKASGIAITGEVVWDKKSPGLGGGIRYQHETILLARIGNAAGRCSLFSVVSEWSGRDGRVHPHEKPIGLMRKIVSYCTRPGEKILDPFSGTGSTLVAAMELGRVAVGAELDEEWFSIADRRLSLARIGLPLSEAPGQLSLFGTGVCNQ